MPEHPHHQQELGNSDSLLDWHGMEGKLYDRSEQTEQLLQAYRRRTSATTTSTPASQVETNHHLSGNQHELILITGPAGGGKTALALTLQDLVEQDGGFFCRGKFNQPTNRGSDGSSSSSTSSTSAVGLNKLWCTTDSAHGPFATVLSQWASLKLKRGGPDGLLELQKILERELVDAELQILVRSIPALKHIIRTSPETTSWLGLQGPDAEMRYNEIFSKFIGVICSPQQPLVVLLDDLQWADSSSLELLKTLMTRNKESAGFLLLATVRSIDSILSSPSSSPSSSCLVNTFTDLIKSSEDIAITEIHVSNFSSDTVTALVSDLLHVSVEQSQTLSQAIYQQTNGNAFFVCQLLKFLEGEGKLRADTNHNIECGDGSDAFLGDHEAYEICTSVPSVLDLVTKKVKQMPSYVQEVLTMAACMGSIVPERLLAEVCSVGLTSLAVTPVLTMASEQGLILYDQPNGTITFIHDTIQHAVYSLVAEHARPALHLHIGRALWIWLPSDELDTHLFFITNQISHGLHLLNDQVEKEDLAELFLRAGRKAALKSAFSQASGYYETGIGLLGKRHWKHQYRLSLALYNAAAEMEYYGGNLARVDSLILSILKHAKSLDDKLNAYYTKIYSLGSRDDMQQALLTGLEVLKQLGVTFPETLSKARTTIAGFSCRWRLCRMSDDSILNLPVMQNKRQLMVMRLMNTLFIPSYSARPELVVPMVTRMISYTLDNGICGASCIGFGHLGYHLGRRGYTEESGRLVRLALLIMERFDAKEWHSRLAQALYGCFFTMCHPVRESITPLREAHRAGLVVGDIHSSLVCASFRCRISLCASVPLPELLDDIRKYRRICMQYGQTSMDMILSHQEQFCLNLMGNAEDPVILTGEVIEEKETIGMLEANHPYALTWFLFMKHMLAVYFNKQEDAKKLAVKFRALKVDGILPVSVVTHLFLEGMSAADLSKTKKLELRHAQRVCRKVSSYLSTSSDNFVNKVRLLEAEIASAKGDQQVALSKYKESIEAARMQRFLHEQALANERAGYSLIKWGRSYDAQDFLKQAHLLYGRWGAFAKVEQVQRCIDISRHLTTLGSEV